MSNILKGGGLILAACLAAQANGIIHDPSMGVERDAFSTAIFQGETFAPVGTGGGVFGFYNAGASTITELLFEVSILPNLPQTTVDQSFACDSGSDNPFFNFCSIQYVPSTGLLGIGFWGTDTNLHQGIPPLLTGCLANPDNLGCTGQGHFAITLNDSFAMVGGSGGWNNTNSPGLFTNNGVTFTASDISTVFGAVPPDLAAPEPVTFALIGAALIAFGWLARKRRARNALHRAPTSATTDRRLRA